MNVDITNHLIPWTQVKRMIQEAKREAWEEGVNSVKYPLVELSDAPFERKMEVQSVIELMIKLKNPYQGMHEPE